MRLRLTTSLLLASLSFVAAPASGQEAIGKKKEIVDARIDVLEQKIGAAREREGVLTSQIAEVTSKIRALEDDVSTASSRLDKLESVLALHQRKLDRLNQLYGLQTRKLVFLQRQHKEATARLNKRIVEIYTTESPSALTVVLEARSFTDLLEQVEFLNDIGRQDETIAAEVKRAKLQVQETRNSTRRTRRQVAATTATVAARTSEQRAVRDRLAWSQRELATARRGKKETLATVQQTEAEFIAEADGLRADSAALAASIRAAQGSAPAAAAPAVGAASSAGFVWPLPGTVTSYFGARWGRMHEGLDIAAPYGTPVVAAAAGTVISAGWGGGYGNLVVIDHGNGIATAYAHNASLTVSAGQQVQQGQLIAYVGSTGNSTGPHVHFEVRSGGSAVDPLGFL